MSRPRALDAVLQPIARQALGKRHAGLGALLSDWPAIAGPRLADRAVPESLTFSRGERDGGVLKLRAEASDALEIQHDAPRILERINSYYGYRAVEQIKLIQAPPPPRPRTKPKRPLAASEQAALEAALETVEDPALRDRLAELGRSLYARTGRD